MAPSTSSWGLLLANWGAPTAISVISRRSYLEKEQTTMRLTTATSTSTWRERSTISQWPTRA
eukprot:5086292-Amphidinium_carterae.1